MYKFAVCLHVISLQSLYSRVPACQITTYYYVGFAYLMMKRYQVKDYLTITLWLSKKSLTFAPRKCIFRLNFRNCLSCTGIWNCDYHLSPQFKYMISHIHFVTVSLSRQKDILENSLLQTQLIYLTTCNIIVVTKERFMNCTITIKLCHAYSYT